MNGITGETIVNAASAIGAGIAVCSGIGPGMWQPEAGFWMHRAIRSMVPGQRSRRSRSLLLHHSSQRSKILL